MQKLAHQFIDLLNSQQLLSPEILDELRRQVAESKTKLSPELLAKLLVDNGHLTKFQATKLISQMKDASPESNSPASEDDSSSALTEDELGFAPDTSGQDTSDSEPHAAVEVVESVETVDAVVEPVEVVETVDVVADDTSGYSDSAGFETSIPTPKAVRPQVAAANPWDSFRILGVALLLALVLVMGYFLLDWFWRGSADERLAQADSAYEQRSYESAASQYTDFAADFATNKKASYAKVRSALALLRKDSETARDPNVGLQTAQKLLPAIAEEPGLSEQRPDLAGALISLAGKFNERADEIKETDKRRTLMADMDELLALINNPVFVGSNEREQQRPTLKRIEENRKRIEREISRDERLVNALASIDDHLNNKDTSGAYQIRAELISEYPLLEANSNLKDRVLKASNIQQSLVANGKRTAVLSDAPPATNSAQAIVLGNRIGDTASALQGQVVFVKVKGSAFALDGATGDVKWSQYLGRDFRNDPIRVGKAKNADALLFKPEKGKLWRVDGRTGTAKWHLDFGGQIHPPSIEGNDIFISCFDGHIFSIDLESGQTKWVKLLPQPVDVSPGMAFGKPYVYIPGEHSNLYALSRRNGECKEVFYLGHLKGSISVSPSLLLGQLFVFENISTNSARVRILSTGQDGLNIANAQSPLPMEGNIVVSPVQDGRRIAVQSDLGQILILDVEPTLETQKVSQLASVPKNLSQPRLSWSLFERNQLWVADERFTRFDLQVSLAKLNRTWAENDGDTFVGSLQKYDDIIIHTRQLRGNQGFRVAATNADDGSPIWEIDLGVPVSYLHQSQAGKVGAVTTAGAYYQISNRESRSQADANPGQGRPTTDLRVPVTLADDSAVLINLSRPNQIALFTDTAPQLKMLSVNFGSARPTCEPIAVGDNIAVGLNNGQFGLFDPANGSPVSAPYQPAMRPGKQVKWITPVYLPDSRTIVVSSSARKLVRLNANGALSVLSAVDLENPLYGRLAALQNQVIGVAAASGGDLLDVIYYDATTLAENLRTPLAGRLVAGPYQVDDGIVVQSTNALYFLDSSGTERWKVDFPKSRLLCAPALDQNAIIATTVNGQVWGIALDSGAILGKSDAGQALSSPPLLLPTGLLVGSDDGAILALPNPAKN